MDGHGPHKLATDMINRSMICNIEVHLTNKEKYPELKRGIFFRTVKAQCMHSQIYFSCFHNFTANGD